MQCLIQNNSRSQKMNHHDSHFDMKIYFLSCSPVQWRRNEWQFHLNPFWWKDYFADNGKYCWTFSGWTVGRMRFSRVNYLRLTCGDRYTLYVPNDPGTEPLQTKASNAQRLFMVAWSKNVILIMGPRSAWSKYMMLLTYLIFVTDTTDGVCGEKIGHVEKFSPWHVVKWKISPHDKCGETLSHGEIFPH